MRFHSKRLADGRWGIYEERRLLATIGCSQLCQGILLALQQRQTDLANLKEVLLPAGDREGTSPDTGRWVGITAELEEQPENGVRFAGNEHRSAANS